jgi:hypothetical protein
MELSPEPQFAGQWHVHWILPFDGFVLDAARTMAAGFTWLARCRNVSERPYLLNMI